VTDDLTSFERVDPDGFRALLRVGGWSRQPDATWSSTSELWLHDDQEVLLPLRRSYRDYGRLIRQAIADFATATDQPTADVLNELLGIGFDTVRFRVGTAAGVYSIGLHEGRQLLGEVWQMMYAAAAATVEPRRTLPPRNGLAEQYMRQLRLPAAERGSFILAVQSPVPTPADIEAQDRDNAVALDGSSKARKSRRLAGRDVLLTLVRAVDAADRAATQALKAGELTAFDQSVSAGVTANLCKAIASLETLPEHFVEFAVDPSPLLDTDPDERPLLTRARRLQGDRRAIYESAAEHLSRPGEATTETITGYVTQLRRPPGSMFGRVIIRSPKRRQAITVLMPVDDYSKAVRAHDTNRLVQCTGVLRPGGHGRLAMDRPDEVRLAE